MIYAHENHLNLFKKFKKKFSGLNTRKMPSHYKNKDLFKKQPFYSEEIKNWKKKKKKTSNIDISESQSFSKKLRKIDLSKELPFFPPKRKKDIKTD